MMFKRSFVITVTIVLLFWICSAAAQENTPQVRTFRVNPNIKVKTFQPKTAVLIKQPVKFKTILRPVIPAKPVKPTGPDPKSSIDLSDMIEDTDLLEDLSLTCGWDPHLIFQDKTAGNVFYYLPRSFVLAYDAQSGYGLSVQYNHLKAEGDASVLLTAQLKAPHHSDDILVLKKILKQAFGMKEKDTLTLKAISGIGSTADVQAISAGLSLPAERIQITAPAHLKQLVRLTLSLTQDETEEVLALIAGQGLAGTLNVKVDQETVPVPVLIAYSQFAGNRVDGFTQWTRNQPTGKLGNISSFPLTIKSINGYKVINGQLERISKALKPSVLGVGQKKAFKLPEIKRVLGAGVLLAWLETELDTGCEPCLKKIDKTVRKGVNAAPSSKLKFEVIPSVFEDFEMYKLVLQVQSPYFNTEPGPLEVREIELTSESNISENLVIYLPQGKGADALLFRYRMSIVQNDGSIISNPEWTDSRTRNLFLGSSQIEPMLENGQENQ